METIFSEIQDKIKKIHEKYLLMYFVTYSNQKTPETAWEFLKGHYREFSKEITLLTIQTTRAHRPGSHITSKLMDLNGKQIVGLYDKIIDISK